MTNQAGSEFDKSSWVKEIPMIIQFSDPGQWSIKFGDKRVSCSPVTAAGVLPWDEPEIA
jgi:hypothetical protein